MEQNWRHEVNKGSSTFREAKKIASTTVLGNISGGMYRRMDLNGIICSLRSICIYSNSISNSMVKSVKVHIVLIVQYQIPFNIKFNLKFPYHSPKWIQFHIMFKEIPLSSFKSLQALPPCTPVASAPASLKAKGSLSSSIPMSPWRLADATHHGILSITWSWWKKTWSQWYMLYIRIYIYIIYTSLVVDIQWSQIPWPWVHSWLMRIGTGAAWSGNLQEMHRGYLIQRQGVKQVECPLKPKTSQNPGNSQIPRRKVE